MEKKLQKIYLTDYNLLIVQDLWQVHYQILSIIFLNEFIKLNVHMDTMVKKLEIYVIKYKCCDCFLEYADFKDGLIEYKCLCCNKNYQQKLNEKLKGGFFNTYKVSIHNNDKFIFSLRKCVYPYVYMDEWKKFNETSLPEKEDVYSHLNIEDITDADYAYGKRICKDSK